MFLALLILSKVVGGLGIFMLGMKFLSEGIQTVAGPSLRKLISQVTDNRFLATGTGTVFTLLVQSSSIATVVMVGLVNAGLMQLHQAVGFIMGANIGTTITGWILMFKVGDYGLPVLGIAALVFVFSNRDRWRFIAMAVMGLGMVFFGLQLMKDGVAPFKDMKMERRVTLPELAPGLESGEVKELFIKVGDVVEKNQSLLSIETEHGNVTVTSDSAGTIVQVLVKEGDTVTVGELLVRIKYMELHANSYLGILLCVSLGCLLTLLVQSSSAALGILIAAASVGLISFPAAAAFILGENIGTTITVVLASLNATTNAKRAALAHVLFNVIGVTWAILVFPFGILAIASMVQWVHGVDPMSMSFDDFKVAGKEKDYAVIITAAIATVHTSFNITNTCVFLPFVPQFARLLERLVKGKQPKETPHLVYLTSGSVESPAIGIEQSRREMIVMAERTENMMRKLRAACLVGDASSDSVEDIRRDETILDNIESEIVAFLSRTLQSTVSSDVVKEGQAQLRIAHELESIGDHLANIAKDFSRLKEQNLSLSAEQSADLVKLHDMIQSYLSQTVAQYKDGRSVNVEKAKAESRAITEEIKRLRTNQMQLVVDANFAPELTMTYTGTLTHYRRIRGHILNFNQARSVT